MLKRVDVAAYDVFKTALDGTWEPGFRNLGLAEDGVGWALDEHNQALISDEMAERVQVAQAAIVAGEMEIHDYMATNSCP